MMALFSILPLRTLALVAAIGFYTITVWVRAGDVAITKAENITLKKEKKNANQAANARAGSRRGHRDKRVPFDPYRRR